MAGMYVPSRFRTLREGGAVNGSAVTADKAALVLGDAGWIYEGLLDRPVPGNELRGNLTAFDHTGDGRGRPLPVIQNLCRGLFRAGSDFDEPLVILGDGGDAPVPAAVNDFHLGHAVNADRGWNWRRLVALPVAPHVYARRLRTRVHIRRGGAGEAPRLYAAVYADPDGGSMIGRGEAFVVENEAFSVVEPVVDLDRVPYARGLSPTAFWWWGLRAWVPVGTTLEVWDPVGESACLAVSSV